MVRSRASRRSQSADSEDVRRDWAFSFEVVSNSNWLGDRCKTEPGRVEIFDYQGNQKPLAQNAERARGKKTASSQTATFFALGYNNRFDYRDDRRLCLSFQCVARVSPRSVSDGSYSS